MAAGECALRPVAANWDNTGSDTKAEIGVFFGNTWNIDLNGNYLLDASSTDRIISFGETGDIPVTGDWNGDGVADLGTYRSGKWYLDLNDNGVWDGPDIDKYGYHGGSTDIPVTGDWNGDKITEIGIYRGGKWYLDLNNNGVWNGPTIDKYFSYGGSADKPVTGDWSGNGITKIGIYRGGKWYLDLNNNGVWNGEIIDKYGYHGGSTDIPVTGDWNGDKITEIGIYRGGKWYLDLNNNGVWNGATADRLISTFTVNAPDSCNNNFGPEISVGLWTYVASDLKSASTFQIEANKDYVVKDKNGVKIAQVAGTSVTKANYVSDQNFMVRNSIPEKLLNKEISFEAADGDNSTIVFDVHRPLTDYDEYRGKIKLRFTDSNNIWVINTLPLEQYTWGMGETTGTGHINHTKVMTTIFRTYGQWYVKYATKYLPYGFKIRSDSGSQIYKGYQWETAHPNIKLAAEGTRGVVATYSNDVALTPYSSWSDGRTRSFQERWGSTAYPWCKSVSDPYGKHATLTTAQLEAAGNHMVGLVANGSVKLAANSGWDWQKILKYYYTGISLTPGY